MKLGHVDEFEGLRGLMALWVVVGHWAGAAFNDVSLAPSYAVDVFIILSGFVIAFLRRTSAELYSSYLLRRFLRLFPVYLAVLCVSALLLDVARDTFMQTQHGFMSGRRIAIIDNTQAAFWPHLLAHLTLLHGLVPDRLLLDTAFAFVGQAWSISVEWQFYLVAPLLITWLFSAQRFRSQLGLAVLTVCCIVLARYLGSGFVGHYLHLFTIGIGSFALYEWCSRSQWPLHLVRGALAVLLPLLTLASTALVPLVIWVFALHVVIAARADTASVEARAATVATSAPLRYLGRISYCVYLSHMVVLMLGMRALAELHLGATAYALCLLAITIGGTLLVSSALHHSIEQPAIDLGRWYLQRGRSSATHKSMATLQGGLQ
ncbi:MAG TPA: acyltransferase [Steroidobacteraceae bacterium]|nr:acyltransferase [Steroidobacteraceae bacterium]